MNHHFPSNPELPAPVTHGTEGNHACNIETAEVNLRNYWNILMKRRRMPVLVVPAGSAKYLFKGFVGTMIGRHLGLRPHRHDGN